MFTFMHALNTAKKTTLDWTRSYLLQQLSNAGWSLRKLAMHHGVGASTLQQTLYRPYPRGEQRIAEALGVKPEQIWPSRYDDHGHPNRPMGRPSFVPRIIPNLRTGNRSTGRKGVNVKRGRGA